MNGRINVGGGENLNPVLTEQESLITQILEILPFKGYDSIARVFGFTQMQSGEFSFETDTLITNAPISHELGSIPKMVIILLDPNKENIESKDVVAILINSSLPYGAMYANETGSVSNVSHNITETLVTVVNGSYYFKAGYKYYWAVFI